ncbi:type II secretion system protein [Maricaulis sp.]|uniref:type II secretion system protein n=1 Tax=Maricaulis sp. TaxID=1486257 RepID=UPI002B275AE5|nr:type II secretion system protein [Maricaulis sp.]
MTAPALSSPKSGFTLIEALMSILVLATITALLVPAVYGGIRLERAVTAQLAMREQHARLDVLLSEALMHTQPLPADFGAPALEGGPRSVRIATRVQETGRLAWLVVTFSGTDATMELVPLFGRSRLLTSTTLESVGHNPRFHYFGRDPARNRLVWTDEWSYTHLPRVVVLDFDPVDGHSRRLEIAVPSDGSFACTFDSGLGACLGGDP